MLVVSTHYWPEPSGNAPYVTGLSEALARAGATVTVVTGFEHYPTWTAPARMRLALREERNGVRIRRRGHLVPSRQSALQRGAYELSLLAGGLTALATRRPDVILGVSPALAGAALAATAASLYRAPLMLVFQDILGLAAIQSGVDGGRRVGGVVARCELALARRADRVGVIAPAFREYFAARDVAPSKIVLFRNWSLTEPATGPTHSRSDFGWPEDVFVCLHAGNMGHKQGLENVLEAAELAAGRPFLFVLAGDGNRRAALEQATRERGLTNVVFLRSQATGRFNAMLQLADVLLVNQRGSVGDMSLPSKLTSYFQAGRPVLAAVSRTSAAAREVKRAEAGVVVDADDPAALVRGLEDLYADSTLCARLSARGRRYARSHLSHAAAVDEYTAVVQAMIAGASAHSAVRSPVA